MAKPKRSPAVVASRAEAENNLLSAIDAMRALRDQGFAAFDKIDALEISEVGYATSLANVLNAVAEMVKKFDETRAIDLGPLMDAADAERVRQTTLDINRSQREQRFALPSDVEDTIDQGIKDAAPAPKTEPDADADQAEKAEEPHREPFREAAE